MIFHVDFVYLNERFILVASEKRSVEVTDGRKCQLGLWRTFPIKALWLILPKSKEPCELWKPSWRYAGKVWVSKGSGAGRPSLGEEILSQLKARHLEMNFLLRREQYVGPPPSGFWEKILKFSTHLVM